MHGGSSRAALAVKLGADHERVHGHYRRTVADLPCAGRHVVLALTVRKFVCTTPICSCQIFTERLPDLVQSYTRMTNRLSEALIALGLATSAQVSERLAPALGMLISIPTLLRRLRRSSAQLQHMNLQRLAISTRIYIVGDDQSPLELAVHNRL